MTRPPAKASSRANCWLGACRDGDLPVPPPLDRPRGCSPTAPPFRLPRADPLHGPPARTRVFDQGRRAAPLVFALALLVSGFASSTVGSYAGQVIMAGFTTRELPSCSGAC
jgi:Natural resistance-associated macrophage protein